MHARGVVAKRKIEDGLRPLRYRLCFPACASPTPVSFLTSAALPSILRLHYLLFFSGCASQRRYSSYLAFLARRVVCYIVLFATSYYLLRRVVAGLIVRGMV